MRNIRIAGILAGLLFPSMAFAGSPPPGPLATPVDDKIERMTDLVVQAVPFGRMFEMAAEGNPKWPVQENQDAVDATQLACLRGELSPEGFRRNKRAEVAGYVALHPTSIDDEIKLMESGGALLMGKAMLAGAESGVTGKEVDSNEVLRSATPEQFMAFISFINAPEYADLRKLAGIGDAIDLARSGEENEKSGERAGVGMAAKAILQAMGTCKVPMSALLPSKGKDS